MRRRFALLLLFAALTGCNDANIRAIGDVFQSTGGGTLSESDIAAGLKEALATGTERAILRIGRKDGFWQNMALRIPLPEKLERAGRMLRKLGQGAKVDEFQLSLNRAAEQAVPEAASLFAAAIREMTLADARDILRGPDDAATVYFRGKTSAALTARFQPVVAQATSSVGVTQRYKAMFGKLGAQLPGVDLSSQDIDAYVTERALDALFTTLAEEEKRIREDPVARTTELLKRVFGSVR
jgi:hypothetical protein